MWILFKLSVCLNVYPIPIIKEIIKYNLKLVKEIIWGLLLSKWSIRWIYFFETLKNKRRYKNKPAKIPIEKWKTICREFSIRNSVHRFIKRIPIINHTMPEINKNVRFVINGLYGVIDFSN